MSIKCILLSLIYQFVSIVINNKKRLNLVAALLLFISITHANPPTYAYLPNLKDNQQDVGIVQQLEKDFQLNKFKKFSGLEGLDNLTVQELKKSPVKNLIIDDIIWGK